MQLRPSIQKLICFNLVLVLLWVVAGSLTAQQKNPTVPNKQAVDSTQRDTVFKLRYPIPFLNGFPSALSTGHSPLYLKDPKNLTSTIDYDPDNNDYKFQQKLGNKNFGYPYFMTPAQYMKYDFTRSVKEYWKQRVGGEQFQTQQGLIPKLYIGGEAFDRIF